MEKKIRTVVHVVSYIPEAPTAAAVAATSVSQHRGGLEGVGVMVVAV